MKGKGKGQDPTRDTPWNSPNPYKGKGKGQKGYWKGGQGKGAYSMEDDWSSGYSGYSFGTPLFISSLAQEAKGEWQKVNPKKAARQSSCSAHAACQGHIPRGRYDVLSDCNYNPYFSDFDNDFDLPLMMTRSEEGDVPPGIDSPGGAVFVHEAATARALEPDVKNIRADEFQRDMENYHHQHKARISKNIPSKFVNVYPLENRGDSDHMGRKGVPTGEPEWRRFSCSRTRKRSHISPTQLRPNS